MPITRLHVTDVGPFDEVTLEFDRQVNVLTGPNNCGKSTLLWVLGELLVFPFTMPIRLLRSNQPYWRMETSSPHGNDSAEGTLPIEPEQLVNVYKKIGHTSYVPALRHGTNFRSSGPTLTYDVETKTDEALQLFAQERSAVARQIGPEAFRQSWRESIVAVEHPELIKRMNLVIAGNLLMSDQVVKQKIVDLDYAAYRKNRPEIKTVIDQVASIASEIADGFPVQFVGVADESEGLYPQFRTPDGKLPPEALSQGTQSIIQILAHLVFGYAEYYDFPTDLENKPGILIIDEIDAHLHPTWQRRIIPTLNRHFPNLQIFCSTHSPLMLAGLNKGQVQLLRRGEHGKVNVSKNESDIAGWTADEIFRQFMDVPNPTDAATADRVSDFEKLIGKEDLSPAEAKELECLRDTLRDDLLSGPQSDQVLRFAEQLKRAQG